jgi:hypothetical protein
MASEPPPRETAALRHRWRWHLAALGVLTLGALFNAWEWLARDRMPVGDFPGYVAQIQYVRDALLEHGRVPLWCVECYGGTTNFTGYLKEILSFPLALLLDPILATKLAFLICKIAGGWALYALVARNLAAPGAGIIAGYSLAFGEIANHQIEHLDGVLALAIMPPLVVAGVELLRRGGIGWTVALGVLASVQLVNNGVHALLVPLTVASLAVLRPGLPDDASLWRDRKIAAIWLRRLAAAVAVSLLFAGGQIAWIAFDSRNHRLFPAYQIEADRAWAIERSPFLFVNRNNALAPWLAAHHPPELDVAALDGGRRYIGAVWIAVCAVGALAMRGARHADLRRWAGVAALSIWVPYWLALGPRTLVWEIATSLHWTPAANAVIETGLRVAASACLLLAAGLGWRAWRSRGHGAWSPARRAILVSALLGFPAVSLWSACARVFPMLEQQRSPGRFFDLAPVWLYLLFAVSLVAIGRRIARPRLAAAALVLVAALVVLDFAPSRRQFAGGFEREPLRPALAMIGALPGEGGTLRVGQLLINYFPLASWVIAQSSLGHASGWLTWQANPYWDVLMKGALYAKDPPPRADEPMEPDTEILRAARVRYLLLVQAAHERLPGPWRRVGEQGGFALWELPEVFPVARGYRSAVLLAADAAPAAVSRALRVNTLAVSPSESSSAAALPSLEPTLGPSAPAPIEAESRRLAPERIAIDVDAGAASAVVSVSEAYHPWWRARVDGDPAPVLRANLALMAVPVGPGPHRIELSFERPAVVATADRITAAAWIALLAGIPIGWWIRSRRGAVGPR